MSPVAAEASEAVATGLTEAGSAAEPRVVARSASRQQIHSHFLQPGWPITFTLAGFPVWWIMGISNFVGHIAAVLLLVELLRHRRIRVPRSFGLWFLFLAWVSVGVLMLRLDAPDAAPVTSMGTYATWAYRFGWYISATVFMLYIGNTPERLSSRRITRSLSMFFLTIVAGGWMAILTPGLEFPSLLEVVLPRGITQIDFVSFLIHPTVVQDYAESVAGHPRPSAPFAYANFWGLNLACALPFFVITWLGRDTAWGRRLVGFLILLLAVVPMILSWNRGLWLAILVMVAVLALRSGVRGHVKTLLILLSATAIVVVSILLSPLGDVIQSRIDNPTSNSTRTELATLTTNSVLEGSPIVGFGSTRDSATSFYSIAGGDSPTCPECSPPAMGTQGQFWLVLFAQGVLGILFFYGFLLIWFARALRTKLPASTAALCAVLAHLVTMTVYDSLGIGTVVLMVAIALLWREVDESHPPGHDSGGTYTVAGYLRLVRQNAIWVAVLALLGAVLGGSVQLLMGNPVIATTSVIVPVESASDRPGLTTTLDTLSRLARSERVRLAIEEATGGDVGTLDITATQNSRILNLRYTGDSIGSSLTGVTAATDALLDSHRALLEGEQRAVVEQLDTEYASLLLSLSTVDSSLETLRTDGDAAEATLLQKTRAEILTDTASAANESARVGSLTFEGGRVVRSATARFSYDPLVVKAVSGLMLGMLVGLLTARLRDIHSRAVGSVPDLADVLSIDGIASVDSGVIGVSLASHAPVQRGDHRLLALSRMIEHSASVAVMPGDSSVLTRRLANRLDTELIASRDARSVAMHSPDNAGPQIVIVVAETALLSELTWCVVRHRRNGLAIIGLILITDLGSFRQPMRLLGDRRCRPSRSRRRREIGAPRRGTTSH